jgi:hypothetical protein
MQSNESEIEKTASRLVSYSMGQLMEGKAAKEVENDLMARGVSQGAAKFLVEQAMLIMKNRLEEWHKKQINQPKKSAPIDEKKEAGKMQMFIGGILLGVGLLVTLASYGMSESGSKYVIAYGAMIVGAWNMIRGFFRSL